MDDREKELRLLQIRLAFANNMRTLRQRKKLKQPELAALCGLHRITVVRLESQKWRLSRRGWINRETDHRPQIALNSRSRSVTSSRYGSGSGMSNGHSSFSRPSMLISFGIMQTRPVGSVQA